MITRRYCFELARRVEQGIEAAGMTRQQLADKLNVSLRIVDELIKGERNTSLEEIERLEAILGTKLINIP